MEHFTIEEWEAEQERLNNLRTFCGAWMWGIIALCVVLRILS